MRSMRFGTAVAVFPTLLACQPQAAPPVDTAAEIAAVEAVRGQEVAAILAGDTSLAYMTDDAVMMPPNGPEVAGKGAVRAWMAEFMAMATVQSLTYDQSQITVAGDWAIERYTGTLTMAPAGGGDAMTETVKGIHVYRKGADGSWKMTADVWNSNTPLPGM